jgi:uncharacterized protein (TIGR00288 family)
VNPDDHRAPSIAIFCDFENVALGVRDAKYSKFDIQVIIERLHDKGKIVVKRAYADWDRYKSSKRPLHEAAFELIEIPHVSYSGKNSADIRMVVDALDLCYTKSQIDAFVLITGDSDFSPLVSKLRENDKKVIGLGVKNSSSDLLIENCDEFIFYDDLVRRKGEKSDGRKKASPRAAREKKEQPRINKEASEAKRGEALELVLDTVESLFTDRDGSIWGSMIKQTLKRKKPGFSESFHGYRSFNQLLEDAQDRGLLDVEKDAKSGGYIISGFGPKA